MFFSMQMMRSRADTRCFKRSRSLLRMYRQDQVSHVSTLPAYASLYRRRRFNLQRVRREINSARRSTVYKALRNTLEQHVIDGGDYQSLEYFIHFNDEEIRRILQDAVDVHK